MRKRSKGFEFFPHPADAKFRAYGASLEEAFRNAAYGLVSLMWDKEKISSKIEHSVFIEGRDLKQLLVGFLEELLFLLDSRSFLLHSVDALTIAGECGKHELKALFRGDTFKEGLETFGDVKAITYHEMMIDQGDPFMVQVVVDV